MTSPAHVGAFDISADERAIPDLVATLLREPSTRALLVRGDRARIADGGLVFSPVDEAPDGTTWAFLGRADDGAALLLGALPAVEAGDDDTGWTSFRDVGAVLDRADADLLVAGIALGRWLVDSGFCPTCGTAAPLSTAGWARHCPTCDRELFPRTDPAVIVAIVSQDGERLLLGANAAWGGAMFSCFAGFVEAGESAERAIHRELREEAGVRVTDLRYVESQAWPFPRSLMLGFHATVVDEREVRADGEEIVQARWFTREEIGRGLAGELDVRLPGEASVANRLIRAWHEASGSGAS